MRDIITIPRNKKIIRDYYNTAKTMEELGKEHNLTKARISQIIKNGKSKT